MGIVLTIKRAGLMTQGERGRKHTLKAPAAD